MTLENWFMSKCGNDGGAHFAHRMEQPWFRLFISELLKVLFPSIWCGDRLAWLAIVLVGSAGT